MSDLIQFIEALDIGAVHLCGHSRGGHISSRSGEQRPDLIRKLILAEPGGTLDPSLAPESTAGAPSFARLYVARLRRYEMLSHSAKPCLLGKHLKGEPWEMIEIMRCNSDDDNVRMIDELMEMLMEDMRHAPEMAPYTDGSDHDDDGSDDTPCPPRLH